MKYRILLFAFLGFGALACWQMRQDIHPLTKSWEKVIPHQEPPEGLTSISASYCGTCHRDHYDEWKLSTHALAWHDAQFQAEIKKESSPFMCINCHIPLQNQQEYIVEGLVNGDIYQPVLKPNPNFDYDLQQEAITCATCHVRDRAIIGATGSTKAPHKVVKDPEFLSEKLCIGCHNASAELTETLVCTFETGDEWRVGPYVEKENCISCHLEEVERAIAPGMTPRLSHRHWFAGSGIPKFDTVVTKMLNGLVYYPTELPNSFETGDSLGFEFTVKNELAGHRVPTGDPERFFLIRFALKSANGVLLAEQTERIGEKWEWYPRAKKIADNNLYPKEARTYRFNPELDVPGSLTLTVRVTKHRLDEASAAYNQLGHNYPLFIEIYEEHFPVKVQGAHQ